MLTTIPDNASVAIPYVVHSIYGRLWASDSNS